jgi:hypothetical protein
MPRFIARYNTYHRTIDADSINEAEKIAKRWTRKGATLLSVKELYFYAYRAGESVQFSTNQQPTEE